MMMMLLFVVVVVLVVVFVVVIVVFVCGGCYDDVVVFGDQIEDVVYVQVCVVEWFECELCGEIVENVCGLCIELVGSFVQLQQMFVV